MQGKCEICEKPYYIRPSHWLRVKRHFCSRKCRGLGQRGISNPAFKKEWIKTCKECYKQYQYKDSKGKIFCSQKCMGVFKHKALSLRVKCGICNILFMKAKSIVRKENFCSIICKNRAHSQRMSLGGNSNWRGGIGNLPYHYFFNQTLKDKIRERDNYLCQNCGKKEQQEMNDIGQHLVIHHIDYDKMNCNETNLIAVCNICNVKANYGREVWMKQYKQKIYGILTNNINQKSNDQRAVCV